MSSHPTLRKFNKLGRRLARPDIMFYTMPYLMVLLIAGTLAQAEIGLYHAERLFFASWILWVPFGVLPLSFPLPGGYAVMSVLFVNLLAKFLFGSTWSWRHSGTIVTHFGILLLFIGAIFTSLTTREGFLLIPEGTGHNIVQSYHEDGLYIEQLAADGSVSSEIAALPYTDLYESQVMRLPGTPAQLRILEMCQNCDIAAAPEDPNRRGVAEKVALVPAPVLTAHEANLGGVTLEVSGLGNEQDGIYISTEAAPHPFMLHYGGATYQVQFRRAQSFLPFSVTLNEFDKTYHPGTGTARSYRSEIEVIDGASRWPVTIQMNEPLRYRGYTFFQSSYAETPQGMATVLAVVENRGWLFPYIASAVIALGLMLHLLLRFSGRVRI